MYVQASCSPATLSCDSSYCVNGKHVHLADNCFMFLLLQVIITKTTVPKRKVQQTRRLKNPRTSNNKSELSLKTLLEYSSYSLASNKNASNI